MANNPSAERILFSSDSNVQYLKATKQIELVGQMGNIRQRAQDVALSEQIYC